MNQEPDLHYDQNSFAGPFDEAQLKAFETWLHYSEYDSICFGDSYINHLKRFHGGVPRKRYFRTAKGDEHSIVRFLNFLGSGENDVLEEYAVEVTWSNLSDRMGKHLMPFAELFAGDMLCFDFSKGSEPEVAVWYHELSHPGKPYTEFVSESFDAFLKVLYGEEGLSRP